MIAAVAALTAGPLVFHRAMPNSVGRAGSLPESFLPWLGMAVVVLFAAALLRRSATALLALLLSATAWTYLFGGLLLPEPRAGARHLVVVQHDVSDENTDPAGTARALAGAGADLIALEELVPAALPVYERTLARRYPYHEVRGAVGLWPRHPLTDARLLSSPRGSPRRGVGGCGPWSVAPTGTSRPRSRPCPRSGPGRSVRGRITGAVAVAQPVVQPVSGDASEAAASSSGPAMKPSRDMDMYNTSRAMTSFGKGSGSSVK
ncbi:endonuclease/exonuclease/phosphatase family protein [Streptomyces sp. NPDC058632]|uniref:endonuclease/exonuclease/phosphatase family protein n=1 Tax=Streptomyces sp. NPDC058632 TaxID=3346567 RepID=UPI00365531CB